MFFSRLLRTERAGRSLFVRAAGILLLLFVPARFLPAETWGFSADKVSSVQSESETTTVLEGRARVVSDDMEIRADYLKLEGEDFKSIIGHGGVSLDDSERGIRIESGRFDYDREAGIIRFRDLVTLVDEEQDIVIRCESLDFLEDEELLILQVSVRLIKDRTVCRGEFATFRREENILDLSGRPVVWREDDEYKADRIRIDLESDEITMEGTVVGELTAEGDEDEREGAPDEGPLGAPPESGGPPGNNLGDPSGRDSGAPPDMPEGE